MKYIAQLQYITHPAGHLGPGEQARLALQGGCKWVQLRMKGCQQDKIYAEALKIKALKASFDFTFIINDHPELARQCGADGVHLGKQDCSPVDARKLTGLGFIIGGTANTLSDVERLAAEGVDYVGLGPFRFTRTKENLSPVLGSEGYRAILNGMKDRGLHIPVVGIGGICLDDVDTLMQTGLHGLAVSSSILNNGTISLTTGKWLKAIQTYSTQKQTF